MANRVWAHFRPASEPLTPRITRQCSKKKRDRKSTRLNSSHLVISYAVFCFKKSTRLNSSHLVISYAAFCLTKKITNSPPPRDSCRSSRSTGIASHTHERETLSDSRRVPCVT